MDANLTMVLGFGCAFLGTGWSAGRSAPLRLAWPQPGFHPFALRLALLMRRPPSRRRRILGAALLVGLLASGTAAAIAAQPSALQRSEPSAPTAPSIVAPGPSARPAPSAPLASAAPQAAATPKAPPAAAKLYQVTFTFDSGAIARMSGDPAAAAPTVFNWTLAPGESRQATAGGHTVTFALVSGTADQARFRVTSQEYPYRADYSVWLGDPRFAFAFGYETPMGFGAQIAPGPGMTLPPRAPRLPAQFAPDRRHPGANADAISYGPDGRPIGATLDASFVTRDEAMTLEGLPGGPAG